jgi:hypothetical protein
MATQRAPVRMQNTGHWEQLCHNHVFSRIDENVLMEVQSAIYVEGL